MSVVGDNIYRIRTGLGISQKEVGAALGHTGGSYISAIERGEKHPSPEKLGTIAHRLGVKPEDLKKTPEQPSARAEMKISTEAPSRRKLSGSTAPQ